MLAMAGLYEIWRDPAKDEDDPTRFLWTCTVLTTSAEDSLGHIHDRMPLMLSPDRYEPWLDPRNNATDDLLGLLEPAAPGRLEAFPVSTLVSNVKNNGPELVVPLPLDDGPRRDAADADRARSCRHPRAMPGSSYAVPSDRSRCWCSPTEPAAGSTPPTWSGSPARCPSRTSR